MLWQNGSIKALRSQVTHETPPLNELRLEHTIWVAYYYCLQIRSCNAGSESNDSLTCGRISVSRFRKVSRWDEWWYLTQQSRLNATCCWKIRYTWANTGVNHPVIPFVLCVCRLRPRAPHQRDVRTIMALRGHTKGALYIVPKPGFWALHSDSKRITVTYQ